MTLSTTSRRFALAAGVLSSVLVLSACGGSDDDDAPSTDAGSSADSALAGQVPDEIKEDGKLTIGTDASYAPNEFVDADGKTVVGFEVDMFTAIADKLGLEVEFQNAPFDSIITGVSGGKYEIGVSSFTINDERKQEVNMVSYFQAGTQWGAGKDTTIDPDDACGKRVAVQTGTVQVDDLTARSTACTDAGKPEITIDQYEGQDQATAAVVAGKDDAMLADSPVLAYAVEQTGGDLKLVGDIYDAAPYGFVIPKDQTDFADAIAEATKAAIADGSYTTALEEWGVEAGGVTEADVAVNP